MEEEVIQGQAERIKSIRLGQATLVEHVRLSMVPDAQ